MGDGESLLFRVRLEVGGLKDSGLWMDSSPTGGPATLFSAYGRVCIYESMYLRIYVPTYLCIYVHVAMCLCIYVCVYACMHACLNADVCVGMYVSRYLSVHTNVPCTDLPMQSLYVLPEFSLPPQGHPAPGSGLRL